MDIRRRDTIVDAQDPGGPEYYVEAVDEPCPGMLTVCAIGKGEGGATTCLHVEQWWTARALELLAAGRFRLVARQLALPHLDGEGVAA